MSSLARETVDGAVSASASSVANALPSFAFGGIESLLTVNYVSTPKDWQRTGEKIGRPGRGPSREDVRIEDDGWHGPAAGAMPRI